MNEPKLIVVPPNDAERLEMFIDGYVEPVHRPYMGAHCADEYCPEDRW